MPAKPAAPPRPPRTPAPAVAPDESAVFFLGAIVSSVILYAAYKTVTAHPYIAGTAVAFLLALVLAGLRAGGRWKDRQAAKTDPPRPGVIIGTVKGDWLFARTRPFRLPWSAFTTHVLIDGPTGGGKTFTFIDPILRAHVARKNTGVLYLDGKGTRIDLDTPDQPGVAFDAVFAPDDPARSARWNPLAGPDPARAAAAFAAALFPQGRGADANFYEQRGAYTVARVAAAMSLTGVGIPGMRPEEQELIAALKAAGLCDKDAQNLAVSSREECLRQLAYLPYRQDPDLKELITRQAEPAKHMSVWPPVSTVTIEQLFRVLFAQESFEELRDACTELAARHPDPTQARRLEQYAADMAGLARSSAKDRASQLANLQNRLAPFLEPPFLELCSGSDLHVSDICAGRSVAFLLSTGRFPNVAEALGRLVLAQFRQEVLASQPTVTKLAVLDEFHNFVSADWLGFLNQARSCGGGAVMAVQSIAAFEQEFRDGMLANVSTVILTPGCQPFDAEHWSRTFGEVPVAHVSHTYEPHAPLTPRRPPSTRVEDRDRPRFTPTQISELDKRCALIRTVSNRDPYPPTVVDVERGT